MSARLAPAGSSEGESLHASLRASGGSQRSLAFLTYNCVIPISSSITIEHSLCVTSMILLLKRYLSLDLEPTLLIQDDFISRFLIILQRPLFRIRSHLHVSAVRTWMYLFKDHHQPTSKVKMASLVAQMVKNLPSMQQTQLLSLGQEHPLEKGMATHPSTPSWEISWIEEPSGLQSMGLQIARCDWVTETSTFHFYQPTLGSIYLEKV